MTTQTDNMELYCKLFVDVDTTAKDIADDIAQLLGGTVHMDSVETESGFVDVEDNDDFDEQVPCSSDDEFLYYRFYLDIDPSHNQGHKGAVALVSKLLEHFWSSGYPAVAACGYEDELPNNGKLLHPQLAEVPRGRPLFGAR